MHKLKLLKDLQIGEEQFKSGDIVEVDSETAMNLLSSKSAEMATSTVAVETQIKAAGISVEEAANLVSKAVSEAIEKMDAKLKDSKHFYTRDNEVEKPYKNLGEQLRDVKKLTIDHDPKTEARLKKAFGVDEKAASGMNELIDTEGGFLVEQDFSAVLEQRVMQTGLLTGKVQTREVTGNGLTWNDLNDYNRTDGNRAVTTYWTAEAADMTASKPDIQRMNMQLEKLTGLFYATDELLEDYTALAGEVTDWFGGEFGFKLDNSILRGTGAGMPLGVLNAPCLVTQAKESAQTATTINATNCVKMFSRMPAELLAGAEWYINADAWPQLPLMTIGDQPIFLPPNGLIDAPAGMLLGKRINMIEQASTLGTVGDIMLANFGAYKMIRKGGVKSALSIHVRFVQNETAFRFVVRANGQPAWRTFRTPAQGSNTTSPFVVLATRS